jgi:hypothetical protein
MTRPAPLTFPLTLPPPPEPYSRLLRERFARPKPCQSSCIFCERSVQSRPTRCLFWELPSTLHLDSGRSQSPGKVLDLGDHSAEMNSLLAILQEGRRKRRVSWESLPRRVLEGWNLQSGIPKSARLPSSSATMMCQVTYAPSRTRHVPLTFVTLPGPKLRGS